MKSIKKALAISTIALMLSSFSFAQEVPAEEDAVEQQTVETTTEESAAETETAAENADETSANDESAATDIQEEVKAEDNAAEEVIETPANVVEATAQIAKTTIQETVKMLMLEDLKGLLTWGNLAKIITSLLAILIFYIIYRIIKGIVRKNVAAKVQPHTMSLVNKIMSYVFYVIMAVYILGLFGIKLSAVWGAAGVAGLAIGFAAQTSVSNLISGLFVLTEKTMKIGDFIEVDGVSGTVDSIGLLSVRIHTLDNQMIRIPNSTIINTKLENYSSFSYRRYVFQVSIDYGSDLDKALESLKKVPAKCPTVIKDNEAYQPGFSFTTLGDSGINMNIIVWCKREDFFQTKTDVCMNVVKTFNEDGINIPFNRMDVTLLNEKTIPSANYNA